MARLRLTLEYDGTDFAGFQLQPDVRSVQGVLEAAVAEVTGVASRVFPAGRTDAGVHARGQVAHLDSGTRLAPDELSRALNATLPGDLSVRGAARTPDDWHARRDALGKVYTYRILNRVAPGPLVARFTWHLRAPLDLAAMRQAAASVLGTHDFGAFRGAPGGPREDEVPRRSLERLDVESRGDEVWIVADGRSFLRHMVRNLVGTLVEVGQGRRPAEDMWKVLESRDRANAGPTAPAHGLCLESVRYAGDAPPR